MDNTNQNGLDRELEDVVKELGQVLIAVESDKPWESGSRSPGWMTGMSALED